ncbi:MAG TPA: hypothetical protein VK955_07055 [Xanthobacteraceae bacterium]|nr:hypothetical protein [Xanthobacteraceae bacterium]
MAKRKADETSGSDTAATPDDTADKTKIGPELPAVESPSISPATVETAAAPVIAGEPAAPTVDTEGAPAVEASSTLLHFPRFHFRPRHKRYALLAASVAIAAAFGAVVGAAATGGFSKPPAVDIAAMQESKATQQSVAHLSKEITNLKASLDAANKAAHSQIAKLSDRLSRETSDITGSVAAPQTTPSTPQASAPLPAPRPPQAAARDPLPPARQSIVPDWSIRETRDGYVYVQGHGDVYQVVPGAPLPGLGPVEQIKRQDGRWLVVTPRGIIISMRDRRYFEQF